MILSGSTKKATEICALQWVKGNLILLDQTLLPNKVSYITISKCEVLVAAIAQMRIRGAPAIGVAAAYGVAMAARELKSQPDITKFLASLERAARKLRQARPTAVNLSWAVDRALARARQEHDVNRIEGAVLGEAHLIRAEDIAANKAIGTFGSSLLSFGERVLTHCNTGALATAGHGTALGVVRTAWQQGKLKEVYITESRPFLQGSRLTAWELDQEAIPHHILVDGAAGSLLRSGLASCVIVGADRIAANGDVANKIGTYSLAVLARENRVPFYVAAPTCTFDPTIASGDQIPLEDRDPQEVTTLWGQRITPLGTQALNPSFDITPAPYISALITERGIIEPPYSTRNVLTNLDWKGGYE